MSIDQAPSLQSRWLRRLDRFVPPWILEEEGDRRTRARILAAVCLGGGALTALGGTLSTVALGLAPGIAWLNVIGGALIVGGAFVLRRTGWVGAIANVLITVGWGMCVLLFLGSGGENLSALYAFCMIPLIAILIGGPWVGAAWTTVCCLSAVALIALPNPTLSSPLDFSVTDLRTQVMRDVVLIIVWLSLVGIVYDRLRSNAQRAAEEAQTRAQESEQRFAQAFEANPDGVAIAAWDTMRTIECNERFLEIMGMTREEVLGDVDWIARSGLDLARADSLRQALLETGSTGEFEMAYRRGEEERQLRLHTRRVTLGGRPCLLSTVRDVTAHVRLEEQLRQAQKMEAVGQLAGAVAHDFNNMLTVISGYAENLAGELHGEQAEMAGEIHRAADRSADLTRQLLAFSRRQVLTPRLLDLNEMLRDLEKLLMRLIGETIEIELVLAPDLGPVRADPGQIEQVVVNLAINARDAMPEGGTLRLETSNGEAPAAGPEDDGEWVRFAVSDDGQGMDEATLHRAFEPFFTTKEQGKGTGLGLSTVHGIVSQSGGEITMRSDPGRGTLVEVYLPRAVPEPAGESAGLEGEKARLPAGSGHVILLVEDDAMVRRLASRALASAGYEVIEASDGVEALETFEACQDRVDLVLTDVVMPRRSGADLVRALRDLRPSLPVLFMSGYPNPREGGDSPLPASEAFIQKPFSPNVLRERVGDLLGHKRDDIG